MHLMVGLLSLADIFHTLIKIGEAFISAQCRTESPSGRTLRAHAARRGTALRALREHDSVAVHAAPVQPKAAVVSVLRTLAGPVFIACFRALVLRLGGPPPVVSLARSATAAERPLFALRIPRWQRSASRSRRRAARSCLSARCARSGARTQPRRHSHTRARAE